MGFFKLVFLLTLMGLSKQARAQLTTATPEQLNPTKPVGRALDHSNDPLDDAAEIQLQQALNDIYNNYDNQISSLQGQIHTLASSGMQRCKVEADARRSAADQAAKQADTQSKVGMIEPAAKTLGHLINGGMNMAGSEKKSLTDKLNSKVQECNDAAKEYKNTYQLAKAPFYCDTKGAYASIANCNVISNTNPENATKCSISARGEVADYERQIANLNSQLKDLGSATNELIGSGMQLAASGLIGAMTGKTAAENAAMQKAAADQSEALCKLQVQNQINELQRQIAQLQQAKARDLLMANMQAEYQTKLRRNTRGMLPDEDPAMDSGTPVALNDPEVNDPFIPPVRTVGDNNNSNSGGGGPTASSAAPSGSPSSGGAPAWAFGGGEGNLGGSGLPAQPKGAKYSGTSIPAANSIKGGLGSGFGNIETKGTSPGESGDRGIASVQEVGDGGLRVLLARTSIVHSRHAPTLVKGIDFTKMAKAMSQPERASDSNPATRY